MATLITQPTIIQAAGNLPKTIEEFVGRVNSSTSKVSIARTTSPAGWVEPGQTPEFDEFTVVLTGTLVVETKTGTLRVNAGTLRVNAGQAVHTPAGEWVRDSTPDTGAHYIAVCVPAFSMETVKRDE